jgi:hypothetical protein
VIAKLTPRCLVAPLLLLAACLAEAKGTSAMIDVRPDSRSVILHATHIFRVRVVSALPTPWVEVDPPTKKRTVTLALALEAVYKGKSAAAAGDQVKVEVVQFGRTISRVFAVPGAWSEKSLAPGTEWVVFATHPGNDTAKALADPEQVYPTAEAQPDVELAVAEHVEKLALPGLMARAKAKAAQLGFLFAEYLWSEHGAAARVDPGQFEPIASWLEEPTLAVPARAALLSQIHNDLDRPGSAPAVQDRLVRALFQLLEIHETAVLHDNIMSVYLPNRLQRSADEVFRGHEEQRARATQTVRRYAGAAPTTAIADWLAKTTDTRR